MPVRLFTCLLLLLGLGGVNVLIAQITLRNFDTNTTFNVYTIDRLPPESDPPDSGFVHGTNLFEDIAKGTLLTLPDGMDAGVVLTVRVFFGFKSSAITNETYTLQLYDGDAETGPTRLLGNHTFNLSDIVADTVFATGTPTILELTNPLKAAQVVGQTFFVVLNFGNYGPAGWSFAAIAASDLVGRRVAEEWELWANGTWHNISDTWLGDGSRGSGTNGFHMILEADVEETTVANETADPPAQSALEANFPNPFRSQTTIAYTLAAPGPVVLTVHDVLGKEVARLVDEPQAAGRHQRRFTPDHLPSGTYFYTLRTGSHQHTRTLFLTK